MPDTFLQHAQIDWDDQGRPHSRQYDDIYFSKNEGIEETQHVFLEQNRLRERCTALTPQDCLVIGETGFGTGMNFYCAWQLFAEHAPRVRACILSASKSTRSPAKTSPARYSCGRNSNLTGSRCWHSTWRCMAASSSSASTMGG